ncbi:MAG: hypothetical protein WCO56_21625, partial [Verrucomicrobiota bacterium]
GGTCTRWPVKDRRLHQKDLLAKKLKREDRSWEFGVRMPQTGDGRSPAAGVELHLFMSFMASW